MDREDILALIIRLETIKKHLEDEFFKTYVPDEIEVLITEIKTGNIVPF